MVPSPLLFLAETTVRDEGTIFALVIVLISFASACFVLARMRHPDASRKALLGLAMTLMAWTFLFAVFAYVSPERVRSYRIGTFVIGLAVVAVGVTLSFMGILEIHRDRLRFRRGAVCGYIGLCLGGLYAAFIIGALIVGEMRDARRKHSKTAALNSVPLRHADSPPKPDHQGGSVPLVSTPAQRKTVEVAQFNYRITAPLGWKEINVKKINPNASASFFREDAALYSIVVAKPLPQDKVADLDVLTAEVKKELQEAGADQIGEPEQRRASGMEGVLFEWEMTKAEKRMYAMHWCTISTNASYRVVTWGPIATREKVREAHIAFYESFRLIDLGKRLPAKTPEKTTDDNTPSTFHLSPAENKKDANPFIYHIPPRPPKNSWPSL